jgi:hypothetical protein
VRAARRHADLVLPCGTAAFNRGCAGCEHPALHHQRRHSCHWFLYWRARARRPNVDRLRRVRHRLRSAVCVPARSHRGAPAQSPDAAPGATICLCSVIVFRTPLLTSRELLRLPAGGVSRRASFPDLRPPRLSQLVLPFPSPPPPPPPLLRMVVLYVTVRCLALCSTTRAWC